MTASDLELLARRGLTVEEVHRQAGLLRDAPPPVEVLKPATVGDGIERLTAQQVDSLRQRWRSRDASTAKFVPASGAASRMFAALIALRQALATAGASSALAREHREIAELLRRCRDLWPFTLPPPIRGSDDVARVLDHLLGEEGLGLQHLPKGLLPFHRHPAGPASAFEEQLREGALYLRGEDSRTRAALRFHFTVSPEHRDDFARHLEQLRPAIEVAANASLGVEFSVQSPATDTVALDVGGRLARDRLGALLLRPGGHGALLDNLAAATATADCVFVKNIDNVLPHDRLDEVVAWKQVLGGRLLELRELLHRSLVRLERALQAVAEPALLADEISAVRDDYLRGFGTLPPGLDESAAVGDPERELARRWIDRLDRPLRVCGMVRNEGKPGGGPFWVAERGLQIVESAEIGVDSREVLQRSTHFNPVDLAVCARDRHGRPYDLHRYVDARRVFVADKSHDGRPVRALERPGLWNGAMSDWNTAFIEVPASTFAPVKTVFDLVDPAHQPAG